MRFSLKRLFVVITAIAALLVIGLLLTTNMRQRLVTRAALQETGALSVNFGPDESLHLVYEQPVAASLGSYQNIRGLELRNYAVRASCLQHLQDLEEIEFVLFKSCALDAASWKQLGQLACVKHVVFWGTPVSEEGLLILAEMPQLTRVGFLQAGLSDAQVLSLENMRPDLIVQAP